MSTAALVGIDGSVDWCCLPRFDSPSVFAAILDPDAGGRFRLSPAEPCIERAQRYLPDTNVLETTFTTASGVVTLTDFMPITDMPGAESLSVQPSAPSEIHRVVRCVDGAVEMRCAFEPRHNYARDMPTLRARRNGVEARGGAQTVTLLADVPLPFAGSSAACDFTLAAGESATFVLTYGRGRPATLSRLRTAQRLEETAAYWRKLVAGMAYEGLWREAVVRSFLVLHLMLYRSTGAIVASPTTSLPETIGGTRNWDYRFSWLRDTSFTVDILYRLGYASEADRYMHWLLEQCQLSRRRTRIVYGISPNSSLKEFTLDHLRGYKDSRPVRIGNGAAEHLQMDVFGEVILAIHSQLLLHGDISDEAWGLVRNLAETIVNSWRRRDRGVWEVRGAQQHFVYSKVMCWVGLDYAAYIAAFMGERGLYRRWSNNAYVIKSEILDAGWCAEKGAFRQRYGSDALDASNLVIPFMGILDRDDPRIRQNLDAIQRELSDGPLVWRYLPEETDDGLGGQQEGAFTLLSFWYIGNLIYTKQEDRGFDFFHELISRHSNHLGLFAEMYDPATKQQLGNFPQAYSHTGLIHTALNLSGFIADTPTRRTTRPRRGGG